MPLIADIIVDVPVLQTNQTYSYKVPDRFADLIHTGMRVVVPFGKGSRAVQGFVVNMTEQEQPEQELKAISSVMDEKPVLNKELIALGKDLAYESYSFQIKCYQTMLPAVLKAKYTKQITVTDDIDESVLYDVFKGKHTLSWEDAESRGKLDQVLKLVREDKVSIDYDVADRTTTKKEKYLKPLLSYEAYEDERAGLQKNAYKQLLLLNLLQNQEGNLLSYADLKTQGLTSAHIRSGTDKKWCQIVEKEVLRDPFADVSFEQSSDLTLTHDQSEAYNQIHAAVKDDRHEVFLLKGVTGSGKTEVYLQSIARVLEKGEGALMLVPEIALTPQMVDRFKSRFKEQVAVLHSGLSDGEKYDEWRKISRGEAAVVVGARSSIFAPLNKIGLIIIDEEHETTYKQEEFPKYHARDVAIWRGQYHDCPVILGSATPSLESRARATKGVYSLLKLNTRANQQTMPEVKVVDMREEARAGNRATFSEQLKAELLDRLQKKEQSVLLLNRRGYSSFVLCRDCGYVLECPNCDISQTLHMDTRTMKCHYCGHEEGIPSSCPKCQSSSIRYYGTGTQKVEEELQALIPKARIIRMDVDTTRKKGAHQKLFKRFEKQDADILLGTQMIAKGLDFPNVTLVGVINADTSLGLPDFRSAEKTFQLLTQVSGRSGRGEKKGEVIVQSFNPDHYAIQLAKKHDYETFYKREMSLRRMSQYSPYYFLTKISVSHANEMTAAKKIQEFINFLKPALSNQAIILGPTPKSIARTHNRYHFQVLIKYKKEAQLKEKCHELLMNTQKEQAKGLYISIDYQPIDFV
ncbi:Helicase PriA essential for oriC/DnaA-independent DNA replication [Alkalibacterium sp. AK22]|uniref:primosomal protein N' n=1 Tax=Alkalibacterium sp. AK22 TaxID=1229520 RepID=UPI0004510B21|nr:primosomal protein N' [Alkalibacterium sp. AK22]EXJ24230.1 Helicase PriA essential for oriC/DnaA-independent DNA replication [Alkalibacterium sp. AK22]